MSEAAPTPESTQRTIAVLVERVENLSARIHEHMDEDRTIAVLVERVENLSARIHEHMDEDRTSFRDLTRIVEEVRANVAKLTTSGAVAEARLALTMGVVSFAAAAVAHYFFH